MNDEKDLARELLKENGIEPGSLPEDRRKELRAMIERDKKRVRRMKWATVVSWSVVLLCFLVGGVFESDHSGQAPYAGLAAVLIMASIYVAAACTISLYVRSRSLGQREIQASLADLSAQLEQLTRNQQAKTED